MQASAVGKSAGPWRPGGRRRGRGSSALVLASVLAAAAGCAESLPLDAFLGGALHGSSPGRAVAAAAIVGDAGGLSPDAGPAPCLADGFEPNDEPGTAASIDAAQPIAAVLCPELDIDDYVFAAPAAVGAQFSVRVRFDAALGDIDAVLTRAADGAVVDESSSVIGEEVVTAVSDGGRYVVEVSLFEPGAPSGAPYTLELLVPGAASNDCCTESATPGCNDAAARECVCAADPYCCDSSYDAYCVQLGVSACGEPCAGPANPGSCCSESTASGCGDATVEACVCSYAPFCCSGPYDAACVSLAAGLCGGACEGAAR
jgi:hypothetical protein